MSVAACAEMVERGDPDRFLATMAAPVEARAVLFPLYAFNLEIARLPWVSGEAMICEMRLQWWRDAIDRIATGGAPPAHEIAEPLGEVIRTREVPAAALDALIAARQRDIYPDPFEDSAALHAYIDATAGGLAWAAARALGAPQAAEPAVRDAGWAAGVAAYLRAVPDLVARGRRPLPDGSPEGVAGLARAGLDRLARARRAGLPREAIPALRAGWRTEGTLRRAAAAPERVAQGRLAESEFARRVGLLRRSLLGTW